LFLPRSGLVLHLAINSFWVYKKKGAPMESQVFHVESDSEPGKFYVVDTTTLTCTCAYHNRKLRMLPLDDPHRLCKHLVRVFADKGVPDAFKAHEEDIKWFAKHNASFTSREKALLREKTLETQFYREGKTLFAPDMITVLSRNKKRKYCYFDAKAIEKQITATMTLNGGDTSLTINNLYASYSFSRNTCSFPDSIRFMAPGIVLWLDIEYSELTGENRLRSDENIVAIYKQMTNPKQEVPVGSITTVSREIVKLGQQDMWIGWGEWTEEEIDCNFIRAHVDMKDKYGIHEPTEIEAIISMPDNVLLFRINRSSSVKLFIQEIGSNIILSTSYEQGWRFTYRISMTTTHKFPNSLSYIERAIYAWLEEEVRRARGHLV
jgi:hypothetical protein